MKTLLLSKDQVADLITMKDVIPAVEEGYRAFCSGKVIQPDYMQILLSPPRGELDFKGGYSQTEEIISMKASSGGFGENPEKYQLPAGMGTVSVYDARTCALLCIMDGQLITGIRTGAAGAISTRLLARKDANTIVSIGTGRQARMQIRACREVMDIARVCCWDESRQAMEQFAQDIEGEFGIPVELCQGKQQAVEKADILITTTRGKGSLVEAAWVRPGTHIVAIGTDVPGKQELEPEIFRGARVVCDSIEQCVAKGETHHPVSRGILTREQIHGEIGQILLGEKSGRQNDREITIFDSTGMAIQDLVTANIIYRNALAKQIGTYFEFFRD